VLGESHARWPQRAIGGQSAASGTDHAS
jgi:hypothetical protein